MPMFLRNSLNPFKLQMNSHRNFLSKHLVTRGKERGEEGEERDMREK